MRVISVYNSSAMKQKSYKKTYKILKINHRLFKRLRMLRPLTQQEIGLFKENLFFLKLISKFRYQFGIKEFNQIANNS